MGLHAAIRFCATVCVSLALTGTTASAQPGAPRAGVSQWGPDDQIGTLNMMTDASRAAILERAAGGAVYDLAVDLFVGMPTCCSDAFGDPTFQIWMAHTPARDGGESLVAHSSDAVAMSTHTGTHIDALNHFGLHGEIWNGARADDALSDRGWTRSGVDAMPPIVARGVLLDIPGAKGVDRLPPSYEITVDDLASALRRQGTELRQGDVVLIRTGLMGLWPDWSQQPLFSQPGLGVDAARWLVEERGAMLLGADNFGVEHFPSSDPANFAPVHTYLLAERGVAMLEVLWLEDLARDGVSEFLFIASPPKLRGATGAPVRPLAIPIAAERSR